MKNRIGITTFLLLILMKAAGQVANNDATEINADTLINHIEKYAGKNIKTEGCIVHVCGVDGKKMKLRTQNGGIIKIISSDSALQFDRHYYEKTVIVQGIIMEYKLPKSRIDSLEQEKKLLCHIDNSPCKDVKWVENQVRKGVADSLSQRDMDRLRQKMLQTGKNEVSVFTIIAQKIVIKEIMNKP